MSKYLIKILEFKKDSKVYNESPVIKKTPLLTKNCSPIYANLYSEFTGVQTNFGLLKSSYNCKH